MFKIYPLRNGSGIVLHPCPLNSENVMLLGMSHQIIRGETLSGDHYTYEKVDGKWTDNEGHGKTQEEADRNFVETTRIKNQTEK